MNTLPTVNAFLCRQCHTVSGSSDLSLPLVISIFYNVSYLSFNYHGSPLTSTYPPGAQQDHEITKSDSISTIYLAGQRLETWSIIWFTPYSKGGTTVPTQWLEHGIPIIIGYGVLCTMWLPDNNRDRTWRVKARYASNACQLYLIILMKYNYLKYEQNNLECTPLNSTPGPYR